MDGAIADYSQAITCDQRNATADALADFDKAIALDPQFAAAYRHRSAAKQAQGDAAGAASDLAKADALKK